MHKLVRISAALLIISFCVLIGSCEKKQVPVLETAEVSNITGTSAISGGTITDEGSSTIISRGVCWSTGTSPTIADNKTDDGAGAGSFTSNISDLNGATQYFVRAYATNSAGTGYGMAMSFTTLGQSPTSSGVTATNINISSATLNGTVNANYLSTVVSFEYGTTSSYGNTVTPAQSPITGNTVTTVSSDITGLLAGTIYHYRIKAVNSLGTTYSNDLIFTTLGRAPTAITLAASNISLTSVTLNGSVNANDISTVVTFEYGTTDSYGNTVTAIQSPLTGNTNTDLSASITGLSAGTTYHFRVKAINSLGISNGSDLTFTTGQAPTSTTFAASNIGLESVQLNGLVNANYLSTSVTFEYGLTISYGSSVTAYQSPLTGNTVTNVGADISGLISGTTYHYRIKAVNSLGTTYGDDFTFTTLGRVPTVITLAASNINLADVTLNGSVNANFLSAIITFEYGITTNYGNIVTATQSPVTGNTNTKVSADIIGLIPWTTYHYRLKAVNSLGTSYGSDLTFTTKYVGTVNDVNGNIYNTLSIGNQIWMKENLKAVNYSNGDLIGTTTPATLDISGESTPKYEWAYDGDESNVGTYGRLYTWFAVADSRNVCPAGWHVPSHAEWKTLTDFLLINGYGYKGSGYDIGKSMAATSGWTSDATAGNVGNDQASNNSSGFTALPGGSRSLYGPFEVNGSDGYWWSSTEWSSTDAYNLGMLHRISMVYLDTSYKHYGSSVRCVKD